ncbi:Transmembrane domain-containing protein [Orpheovirus IHUMI-LCC2]|uniref:Transmembrane domain-containing protein n=1 Tax=Orpheovirus IHUMI-LCC2 TaxID=2023057 RepID=A0A2I2L4Z2_9VIRU|nr:Transmembrane domain-containing protein [Orpheovirus IHUMI-LCC2]SNW62603.1 Transmembrane domain-containing protein [Orpheovirus IHUMI-LCC2]
MVSPKLNILSYYLLHIFILLTFCDYLYISSINVYPALEGTYMYGMSANYEKGYSTNDYCDNPLNCIHQICQLFNSNENIAHIVLDPIPTKITNTTCKPSFLDVLKEDENLSTCFYVFITYTVIMFARLIIYTCDLRKIVIGILFFIEKALLLTIFLLLHYMNPIFYIVFILLVCFLSVYESLLIFYFKPYDYFAEKSPLIQY